MGVAQASVRVDMISVVLWMASEAKIWLHIPRNKHLMSRKFNFLRRITKSAFYFVVLSFARVFERTQVSA